MAYRTASTGFSPYHLVFGRSPKLPLDIMLERVTDDENATSLPEYVQDLHRSLEESFKLARENLTLSHSKAKSRYDKNQRGRIFQVGEHVWLYNPAVKQGVSKKLSCLWRGPHTVIDRVGDVIYRIQLIGSTQTLIVHQNQLKLCYGTHSQQQSEKSARTQQKSPTVLGSPATDQQVGNVPGVGDKSTLKPTYASITKLRVGGYTSSHNVGIHPGIPATQLHAQPDVTHAPPPTEVLADDFHVRCNRK